MRDTILILIQFIFLTVTSTAQEYSFLDLTIRDGLPQSQVNTIIQDTKGQLWIGTEGGGLTKYDGLNFEIITTREGIPSNTINTLYKSKNNDIWIGTNTGFAKLVNNKIIEKYYSELSIKSIAYQSDSTLWIGYQDGIYVFHKGKQHLFKPGFN
ncbi:MAG: ligand-binding sensor domain-containing protein [Saprospiraceae bacterium]